MFPLVDVGNIPDREGDNLFCLQRSGFLFGNHDLPIVVRGIQKLLIEHLRIFAVVLRIPRLVLKSIVPLWIIAHGDDDKINDRPSR